MADKIPRTVVHHARLDPRGRVGGVHTFALGLGNLFERVEFTTPRSPDIARWVAEGATVICDNHTVRDWPRGYPVIGFRHGVAAEKVLHTRKTTDLRLAAGQLLAARRERVVWVACAQWIADASRRYYRSETQHVVYHPVDVQRFDGRLDNAGSRLVLHDARTPHKGRHLIERLAAALPEWQFEGLDCRPEEVPERMRNAAAFLHLSRYEGNSVVCNEAMAMNLPCLFTAVGLMRDRGQSLDVWRIDARRAFGDPSYLLEQTRAFLGSLAACPWEPRRWILENATLDAARARWERALASLDALPRW